MGRVLEQRARPPRVVQEPKKSFRYRRLLAIAVEEGQIKPEVDQRRTTMKKIMGGIGVWLLFVFATASLAQAAPFTRLCWSPSPSGAAVMGYKVYLTPAATVPPTVPTPPVLVKDLPKTLYTAGTGSCPATELQVLLTALAVPVGYYGAKMTAYDAAGVEGDLSVEVTPSPAPLAVGTKPATVPSLRMLP